MDNPDQESTWLNDYDKFVEEHIENGGDCIHMILA